MNAWRSKLNSIILLCFLFCVDVGCSLALLLSVHQYRWSEILTAGDQLTAFSSDTVDLCLMAMIRIAAMVSIGFLAVRFGTPPYELASDARKAIVAKREQMRREWRKKQGLPDEEDIEQGSKAADAKRAREHAAKDSNRQPLLSVQERASDHPITDTSLIPTASWDGPSTTSSSPDSESSFDSSMPALPTLPILTEHEKLLQSRRAGRIRNTLLAAVFVIATGMQVFAGVKMVGFDFSDEWTQGILMGTLIVCVNLQQSLLRHIVEFLCAEEGHLFKNLHHHRLHYDELAVNHWCDLCRARTRVTYHCAPCSFDACRQCFLKKTKTRGEGQLRGDKGIKDEKEPNYMLRAISLARPHWLIILVAFSCLLATSAASIVLPNFQGEILDAVIKGDHSTFIYDIKIFILVSVGLGAFGGIKSLAFNIVGSHIANDVRNKLFRAIVVQDIIFFDSMTTGELTSRLSSDTSAMTSPLQTVFSSTLSNLLLLVGGLFMCLRTSWRMTVLAMTSIYPIVIITRVYAKWSSQINRSIYSSLGDASSAANQAISNIRTVRSFGTEEMEVDKYTTATGEALAKSIKDSWANGGTYALTNYLDLATSVLLLWYGGEVAMGEHAGSLTVGQLITFQLYWSMLNNAYSALVSVLNSFTRASGAAQRVLSLMDSLPDIDLHSGLKLDRLRGEIVIKDLTFAYQMRPDNPVLKGVSLHIKPNTVNAIVGRSGGGKSTLIHLLMRFYDPTSGSILLDGHSYSDLNFHSVHRHMGVVTQNTELFAGTIEQNLVYGLEKWTREEVHAACQAAHAHEFIMEFEEGYETRIGERGLRLSTGQRQRLSIARAMLRKAQLLFLDEATSALDAESEHLVQLGLDQLIAQGNCTILLVAHRLSTVMNAHQICVLDGGVIRECGTHDELLSLPGGIYAKLVARQLSRKQNLIEDEAVTAAVQAKQTDRERHEAEEAIKAKKAKLDDFDSLFDELAEQKQREQAEAAIQRANDGTSAPTNTNGNAAGRRDATDQ